MRTEKCKCFIKISSPINLLFFAETGKLIACIELLVYQFNCWDSVTVVENERGLSFWLKTKK